MQKSFSIMNKVINKLLRKGFTQTQIASISGLTQGTISRMKSGKIKSIKLDRWKKLNSFINSLDAAKNE